MCNTIEVNLPTLTDSSFFVGIMAYGLVILSSPLMDGFEGHGESIVVCKWFIFQQRVFVYCILTAFYGLFNRNLFAK